MINRDAFFPHVRQHLFGGTLTQSQVDGMNAILDAWDASGLTDLRYAAYMLGTAFHETARTMRPIKEMGGDAYVTRLYDVMGAFPERARSMGNTTPGDGARYCGRGYVQLTWKANYARMGKLLGVDLVGNPDLAMDPDIAARVMFEGMTKGESSVGDFTGVALENYFTDTKEDWVNARRIINGLDHADAIAATAKAFHTALRAG